MKREEYLSIEVTNGVATLWLDQKDSPVNKVSPETIGLFDTLIAELEADEAVKAIVLISRKKDFIAGADIESFQAVEKKGDFAPITRKGHAILNRIENSSKPVVAAIHGSALGAGLEICLACHARIASNDKSTKLGLPEVQLGIFPGGGGTQRLPRLIDLRIALDMMLTGKNIYASKAKKIGLVDELVHPHKLHKAACEFALKLVGKKIKRKLKGGLAEWALNKNPIGRRIVLQQARQIALKQSRGNYPAIPAILDCVETGFKKGIEAGLEAEAVKFEEMILTPQSRQLIHLFFAMTAKKKNPMKDLVRPIQTLGMLGAGFMGAGIAEVSAVKNINVLLKDIKEETLTSANQTIWKNIEKKVFQKSLSKVEANEIMANVRGQLTYENFETADMVIEAVFEDLTLKQQILADTEAATKDDCIFASNTSALPIHQIAAKAKRPEMVIGMHYFSPVPKMPLLEIIKTEQTADWVIATCLELGIRQGKTCIVVKDGPGFYTTRILSPMMNEALLLIEEGAEIKNLDNQLQDFGFPVGPVTLMDEVGIDVGAHIQSGALGDFFKERGEDNIQLSDGFKRMAAVGYKGRKNGKGFYQYDPKTGRKTGEVNAESYNYFNGPQRKPFPAVELQHRTALMMVNEAVYCLQEGIIDSPLDGDIGAVFGLGFPPFRGGPFRMIDEWSPMEVVRLLQNLAEKHGGRFTPAPLLVEMAEEGRLFY
ncbi:MAG: 3-hydroxyacyl-CoA dehydrogenase NAD-binding domain-containing protein [Chitinophagales bacterium]